ncbi:MAG: disulfide bond formation protein B, partial [Rhodobacteraceae bacterium PARR1]
WWQGPTSCSSGPIDQIDAGALLDQILAAPIVRCDEVAWALGGISMASWNAIISAGLVVVWVLAARRG